MTPDTWTDAEIDKLARVAWDVWERSAIYGHPVGTRPWDGPACPRIKHEVRCAVREWLVGREDVEPCDAPARTAVLAMAEVLREFRKVTAERDAWRSIAESNAPECRCGKLATKLHEAHEVFAGRGSYSDRCCDGCAPANARELPWADDVRRLEGR